MVSVSVVLLSEGRKISEPNFEHLSWRYYTNHALRREKSINNIRLCLKSYPPMPAQTRDAKPEKSTAVLVFSKANADHFCYFFVPCNNRRTGITFIMAEFEQQTFVQRHVRNRIISLHGNAFFHTCRSEVREIIPSNI